MAAIFTKYHGPGAIHGSRVSATCEGTKVVVSFDDAKSTFHNHIEAMRKCAARRRMSGTFVADDAPGGALVWVRIRPGDTHEAP